MSIGELELAAVASATGFSGVVRVDRGDRVEVVKGYRLADRSYGIANEVDTRFALASGTKGLTALPIRAPRLQLEHLTLLDHRVTSSIDNGIEESHPSRDDHPPQREGVDGSRPSEGFRKVSKSPFGPTAWKGAGIDGPARCPSCQEASFGGSGEQEGDDEQDQDAGVGGARSRDGRHRCTRRPTVRISCHCDIQNVRE